MVSLFDFGTVHWIGVLVAFVWMMAFGFLWFAPFLFGKYWMRLTGMTPEKAMAGRGPAMILIVLGSALVAVTLSLIAGATGSNGDAMKGGMLGFHVALGFALPVIIGQIAFTGQNKNLIWFDGLYQLIAWTVAGIFVAILH